MQRNIQKATLATVKLTDNIFQKDFDKKKSNQLALYAISLLGHTQQEIYNEE